MDSAGPLDRPLFWRLRGVDGSSGLTDVDVEIEDRLSDATRSYHSAAGGFDEIRDVFAFSGCSASTPASTETQR